MFFIAGLPKVVQVVKDAAVLWPVSDLKHSKLGYDCVSMRGRHPTLAMIIAVLFFQASQAESPSPETGLTQDSSTRNSVVGEIKLRKLNVFDLSNEEENNWLYRLANRLHIVTKDRVIRGQLLFETGSHYDKRLIEETERILRQNRYLYDANIETTLREDGVVDLVVVTKDVWTLGPDLSLSRKGGENKSQFGIEEQNFLGSGQTLRFNHEENVDRRSNSFEFFDRHLGHSWVSVFLQIADNSDGETNQLSIVRPFYALDARWSAGGRALNDDGRDALYVLGTETAEYQRDRELFTAFIGWSKGLRDGWARRWTTGVVYDDNQFSAVPVPVLPGAIPADRKLVYPFLSFELLQDEFEITSNRDQIGRQEDFLLGARLTGSIGWAAESFGADRDALLYSATASRGFGSLNSKTLLLSANASGRLESGHSANVLATIGARYYVTQSRKRLFFVAVRGTAGLALDLDNPVQLGGDNGLRGYPLRYQNGDSKLLVTLEQRYFTDWYPFQLARIGGAIFADVGRVWGRNPLGGEPLGWLKDVGFGLRLAPTRSSSSKMLHLDIAFPLDGDPTIDSVQISLEAKRSF
jgi:hypothetical protein